MTQLSVLTSQDSPLRIAALTLPSGGRIGMTICPGKQAPTSIGGRAWARDLGMRWYHMPIVDGAAPDTSWDESWSKTYRDEFHQFLDNSGAVLIHCLGGRGRTGTVAAKLLIECGMDADTTIQKVREAREGAIETVEQEIYLHALWCR